MSVLVNFANKMILKGKKSKNEEFSSDIQTSLIVLGFFVFAL